MIDYVCVGYFVWMVDRNVVVVDVVLCGIDF